MVEDIAHGNESANFALETSAESVYDQHNQQLGASEADNTDKAVRVDGRQIALEASIDSSEKGKDIEEQNIGIHSLDPNGTNDDKDSIDGQHKVNTEESNIMDKV